MGQQKWAVSQMFKGAMVDVTIWLLITGEESIGAVS